VNNRSPDRARILLLIPRHPDETVTVRIVLRLSNCSEHALKAHLPRLDIRLDAYVINPADPGTEGSTPTKELVFSETVNEKEDPLVVVNIFEGDEGSGNHVYVTWKIRAFLSKFLHKLALFVSGR
jgi:hypothetical protein